jgi:hypothetical protein
MRALVVMVEGRVVGVMFNQQKMRRFGSILVDSEQMAARFRFARDFCMAQEPFLEWLNGVRPTG